MASVVFVRPKRYAYLAKPAIIDAEGAVHCRIRSQAHCMAQVEPGAHTFIVWGTGTHSLEAEVEAGKIYYVLVKMKSTGVVDQAVMTALGPERKKWSDVSDWIESTTGFTTDADGAEALAEEKGLNVEDVLSKWKERRARLTPEELEERTIVPADGVAEPR